MDYKETKEIFIKMIKKMENQTPSMAKYIERNTIWDDYNKEVSFIGDKMILKYYLNQFNLNDDCDIF